MFCYRLLILLAPLAAGDVTPSEDVLKKELQQFQGSWKALAIHHGDGSRADEDELRNTRLVIDGNKFTATGKDVTITGTFTIDPTKSPKTIDAVVKSKEGEETRFEGIYETEGDTRKSCFAPPGKERPKQFTYEKGYFGFEWKRD